MAENMNRARRQFVAYIFHEIRVPYNVIVLGLAELTAIHGTVEARIREENGDKPGDLSTLGSLRLDSSST